MLGSFTKESPYRLATSRSLGERSEPFLAAKRPTASDEVARKKSDEGLFLKVYTLSSDVSERRTSTEKGLFSYLSCAFEQTFGQIVSIRVKTFSHTNWGGGGGVKAY